MIFYIWRMNAALGSLCINPMIFNQPIRQAGAMVAKANGNTPQEAALLLACQLPWTALGGASPRSAVKWARSGKIDLDRNEVFEALISLGWYAEVNKVRY